MNEDRITKRDIGCKVNDLGNACECAGYLRGLGGVDTAYAGSYAERIRAELTDLIEAFAQQEAERGVL